MMNLISEIAQYAVETDQVIRQLAQQRDDLKRVADGQEQEIKSLRRRIEDGIAENKKFLDRIHELQDEIRQLQAVRNSDNSKAANALEEVH